MKTISSLKTSLYTFRRKKVKSCYENYESKRSSEMMIK